MWIKLKTSAPMSSQDENQVANIIGSRDYTSILATLSVALCYGTSLATVQLRRYLVMFRYQLGPLLYGCLKVTSS